MIQNAGFCRQDALCGGSAAITVKTLTNHCVGRRYYNNEEKYRFFGASLNHAVAEIELSRDPNGDMSFS